MVHTVDMGQNKHVLMGEFFHETQYAVSSVQLTL